MLMAVVRAARLSCRNEEKHNIHSKSEIVLDRDLELVAFEENPVFNQPLVLAANFRSPPSSRTVLRLSVLRNNLRFAPAHGLLGGGLEIHRPSVDAFSFFRVLSHSLARY